MPPNCNFKDVKTSLTNFQLCLETKSTKIYLGAFELITIITIIRFLKKYFLITRRNFSLAHLKFIF